MTQEFKKQRTLSSSLHSYLDSKVLIAGFFHKKRSLGKITFLLIRDRCGLVQIVWKMKKKAKS